MHPLKTTPATVPIDYQTFSQQLFRGHIAQISVGVQDLLTATRVLCRQVFCMSQPTKAHEKYGQQEFFERANKAQQTFNSQYYKQLFVQCLQANGIDTRLLYQDTLGLRIAPPAGAYEGGFRSTIGVHRDTWGTGIQSQINWWGPIWSLANNRTMGFYVGYWQRPLKNTTAQWSFEAYLKSRRESQAGQVAAYPSAPKALSQPDEVPALVSIPCGHLLAFSSAHLHASMINQSNQIRFSFETRTVSLNQVDNDVGAPNVDCASQPPLWQLFRNMRTQQKLTDVITVD